MYETACPPDSPVAKRLRLEMRRSLIKRAMSRHPQATYRWLYKVLLPRMVKSGLESPYAYFVSQVPKRRTNHRAQIRMIEELYRQDRHRSVCDVYKLLAAKFEGDVMSGYLLRKYWNQARKSGVIRLESVKTFMD